MSNQKTPAPIVASKLHPPIKMGVFKGKEPIKPPVKKGQKTQQIAGFTKGTFGKRFKFAVPMAVLVLGVAFAAETATAASPAMQDGTPAASPAKQTYNVNVVNTPTVNAAATITAPGPLTNVGRLASQHVTLEVVSASACATHLQRNKEDGGSACFDLSNDPGQALVITDTSFFGQQTAGNTCGISLLAPGGGNTLLVSVAAAAADGIASKSEHLTTGLVMTGNPVVGTTCAAGEVVLMQGYLVPNQ